MECKAALDTKHAALTETGLAWLDGDQWVRRAIGIVDLAGLMDLAGQMRITHLWIMPGRWDDTRAGSPHLHYSEQDWNVLMNFTGKDENRRIQSLTGWSRAKKSGNHQFTIIFLENTMWYAEKGKKPGPFHDLRAGELLYVISLLEREVGVPIASSPQTAGWKLLQKQHPQWLEPPRVDLRRECHFDRKASRDIIWQCPPAPDELKAAHYIIRFDKSMAFTYASSTTDVGTGTPTHIFHDLDAAPGAPVKRVGNWHCIVSGGVRDAQTPYPMGLKPGEHWLTGPMINLLRAAGFIVDIDEGWIFPEQHDLMVKWAGAIWDARTYFQQWISHHTDPRLQEIGRACERATKKIANSMIGSTASHKLDEAVEESGEESDKRRPDLRAQIQSRNAELIFWNIQKVRQETGKSPCLIYMDACYYLASSLDYRDEFGPLTAREGQMGAWRFDGYQELDSELRAALADKKASTAAKLEILNLRGWSYGLD